MADDVEEFWDAIDRDDGRAMARLIKKGAIEPLQKGISGKALFPLLIKWNKEEIIHPILQFGIDLNQQDERGNTALIIAVQKEKEALVQELIEKGADVFIKNKKGEDAFNLAMQKGNLLIAKLIQKAVKKHLNEQKKLCQSVPFLNKRPVPTKEIQEAFFQGIYQNDLQKVKEMISLGADLFSLNQNGFTGLMLASHLERLEMIDLLIEKGSSLYQTCYQNRQPFFKNSALQIARLYLKQKAYEKLNKRKVFEEQWYEKFLNAFINGGEEGLCAFALKEKGNNINAQGPDNGANILMWAVQEELESTVTKLICLGADVTRRDGDLNTALHRLYLNKRSFESKKSDAQNQTKEKRYKIVKALIEKGLDVNAKNIYSRTALHEFLAVDDCLKTLRLFLEAGSDVNAKDENEITPLFLAVKQGKQALVAELIKNGSKVEEEQGQGETLLHLACQEQKKEVVRLLLQEGANPNKPDKNGQLMLTQAICQGAREIAELLIDFGAHTDVADQSGLTALEMALVKRDGFLVQKMERPKVQKILSQLPKIPPVFVKEAEK